MVQFILSLLVFIVTLPSKTDPMNQPSAYVEVKVIGPDFNTADVRAIQGSWTSDKGIVIKSTLIDAIYQIPIGTQSGTFTLRATSIMGAFGSAIYQVYPDDPTRPSSLPVIHMTYPH